MAPTRMKLRMRKKDGTGKASQTVSAEASPDSKCPICLDRFNNMAYLDSCLHKFCFRCIHEWSKNKAECPLCKQPFNSIFHSIKAENDFKKFVLRPTENGSFASPDGRRFRYRTTQTRERRQPQRRVSPPPPPDNGAVFEDLTSAAPLQQEAAFQRVMSMMAVRRRAQNEGRTARCLREQEMVSFRRALYRTGVRVRSVRDSGRYRDISAAFFQRNPACLHRLLPWLRRELTVLYGTHGSLVNIVQHIIMSRITRYNMEDQMIQDELRPFLLTRTDHFLHEFISFARSPFNMEAYDQHAVYDCPAPSYEEGSNSDSSVIAISEDEADAGELSQPPAPVAASVLSQAPWDDETPGPSYSTTEQAQSPVQPVSESESVSSREQVGDSGAAVQQSTQVKRDPTTNDSGQDSSGAEDCVIVGYVKPMAERTPELVKLSSDSEESVHNEGAELPQEPQLIRFPSLSPPSSVCSSVSKHKSPEKLESSVCRSGAEGMICTSSGSKEGSSPSKRQSPHATGDCASRVTDGGNKRQVDDKRVPSKDDRRCRRSDRSGELSRSRSRERSYRSHSRRSRSTDRSWSARSPSVSVNSDSTLSRDRRYSRSLSRDWLSPLGPSKDSSRRRRENRTSSWSRHSQERSLYSYSRDSYSHYSRERERNDVMYVQSKSYSSSLYLSPDYHMRSQSRSNPREVHRRERRRTRSRTRSGSSVSSRGSCSSHRRSRHEKPGGKRKYKTRHLEETAKGRPSWQRAASPSGPWEKRDPGGRHHKKAQKKESRSPSVEIVYEGKATAESRRHRRHKRKKKKHKRKKRCHRSGERPARQSPVVITINSDSESSVEELDCVIPPAGAAAGQPSDVSLLESILQDLEQHAVTLDPLSSADTSDPEVACADIAFDADRSEASDGERKQTSAAPEDETSAIGTLDESLSVEQRASVKLSDFTVAS